MGTFSHLITLTGPTGRSETVEALVDTGATFSAFPAGLLDPLGVRSFDTVGVRLANGQVEERALGQVDSAIDGVRRPILCLFGPVDAPALLGAHALEAFLLNVDPVARRLVPREGFLL